MDTDFKVVWERYVASWNTQSPEQRHALYASCLSPACVYTDPLIVAKGWEELARYALDFQRQFPGATFTTERFFSHHGQSAARWTLRDGRGAALGDGVSFAEYDERGMLVKMTGFFDTAPPSA